MKLLSKREDMHAMFSFQSAPKGLETDISKQYPQ
jgi:hypothetical protein